MRIENFLVGLTLVCGFSYRLVDTLEVQPSGIATFLVLAQLCFLIIYCIFLITKENRRYIIALLIFLLIGFIGDIMDSFQLASSTYFMLLSEIAHLLIMVQLIVDNIKLKDRNLIIYSSIISTIIFTQYLLTFIGVFEGYLLHYFAFMFGVLLILRKKNIDITIESYLKILVLQYALGSITATFNIVAN